MSKTTPFDSIAKSMKDSADKLNPAAAQEAVKPMMDNLKAWGDLAQKQAQVAQAAVAETMEAFKGINQPQAAFEVMKASAENAILMASKNLKDVTALGVAQFNSTVDAIEKSAPAPEAFASVGKSLKAAASTMENAVESALKTGAAAAKKARNA